jgi:CRP/FNR family cyclic AMP-dependent transcriptional regulator
MNKDSSVPFYSEANQLESTSFFDFFFSEANYNDYGWGPKQIYGAHTVILKQDTPANAVYFIHHGLVKLTWMDQSGHEVIAGLRHQQWLIGAPAVLLEKPYSFTVTTLSDCTLRCISAKNFLNLMKRDAEFSLQMIRILCQEIFNHGKKLVMLGCVPAKDRLKGLLYKFFVDTNKPELQEPVKIRLPLKHKELAQIIAVSPEHLSRLLKVLERQKCIRREKDGILLDPVHFEQCKDV